MRVGISVRITALLVVVTSVALLAGALLFQYVGGLQPCVLCLWQRWPHIAAVGLGLLAFALRSRVFLALSGLSLWASAGIATFHVGVEQRWWPGLAECGGAASGAQTAEELLTQLMAMPVVRCDEVVWSLLGISMAGYNFLISAGIGLLTLVVASHALRRTTP